jgi:hypothetical protein
MVGVDKKKLSDVLKKKETKSSTAKPASTTPKATTKGSSLDDFKKKHGTSTSLDAFKEKHGKGALDKQKEILHSKTHQDLINAAYKAADTLKIAPWVLLRAAGWGHFTDDRGKRYDGPAIDEIEGLDDAQKKALKDVLEIK